MRILLLSEGIFDAVGGGQTVYKNIILSNPQHQFFLPCAKGIDLPANCTGFELNTFFSRYVRDQFTAAIPAREYRKYHIFCGMDYAASVAGQQFDIVDVPDYICQVGEWPEIFERFNVTVGHWLQAAHGTLTNVFKNHWWPVHQTSLRELLDDELETRQTFDAVYGISKSYLQRYEALGYTPLYADPRGLYAGLRQDDAASDAGDGGLPDLTFLGRLDLFKAPPMFAEIAEKIDPSLYRRINIWGSDIHGPQGQSAREEVERHFSRRGLECDIRSLPHAELMDRLRKEEHLILVPSVYETFHLGALEALAMDTPCMVSDRCGFVELIEDEPEAEAHIVRDLSVRGMSAQTTAALRSWAATKSNWRQLADKVFARPAGNDFAGLYDRVQWMGREMPTVGEDTQGIWQAIEAELPAKFNQILGERFHAHRRAARYSPYVTSNMVALPAYLELLYKYSFVGFEKLTPHLRRYAIRLLFGTAYHTVATVLMAREEMQDGNGELATAYFLRAERAGYSLSGTEEAFVLKALIDGGYAEEAKLFPHRQDEGYVFDYLQSRSFLPCRHADRQIVAEKSSGHRGGDVDVTFICTTLNAENKVQTFLTYLYEAVKPFAGTVEFLLVESGSTDRTFEYFAETLSRSAPENLHWKLLKTDSKETIQSAWNRAILQARGKYFNFIGIDETMRPEGLVRLYDYMETHPAADWVVGNATVLEVDKSGHYVKDVIHYNRSMDDRFDMIIESTKSGMVGTLIRKTMFERTGYFDPRFRCAGDTEHKCRILPFAETAYIPFHCGTYLDWPEARVTASPRAEIEDFSAWYLFRTKAGMRYVLQNKDRSYAEALHDRTYLFTKSYKHHSSTDVALATSIAEAFELDSPLSIRSRQLLARHRMQYRELATGLDIVGLLVAMADAFQRAQQDIDRIELPSGDTLEWSASRDNLQEQHSWVWEVPPRSAASELAQAELHAIGFVAHKYRNHRDYSHVVLSQCLSLLTGDGLPSRKLLGLLHALWTSEGLKDFLQQEISCLHNSWHFGDVGAMAEVVAGILGFEVSAEAPASRVLSPLFSRVGAPLESDTLRGWLDEGAGWSLPETDVLLFTGPVSAVRFKGVRDTDLYPGQVLNSALSTGANKIFTVQIAAASRDAATMRLAFTDSGGNNTDADFEVFVNGAVAAHSFDVRDEGGVLTCLIPAVSPETPLLPVTEITIRLASTAPDKTRKGLYYGVVLDTLALTLAH